MMKPPPDRFPGESRDPFESGSGGKEISALAEPRRVRAVAAHRGALGRRTVRCLRWGRHDYLAALMIGRDKLFVCWLEAVPEAIPDLRNRELVRA